CRDPAGEIKAADEGNEGAGLRARAVDGHDKSFGCTAVTARIRGEADHCGHSHGEDAAGGRRAPYWGTRVRNVGGGHRIGDHRSRRHGGLRRNVGGNAYNRWCGIYHRHIELCGATVTARIRGGADPSVSPQGECGGGGASSSWGLFGLPRGWGTPNRCPPLPPAWSPPP